MELIIPKIDDFAVTGDGSNSEWVKAEWQPLARVGNGNATYATRTKVAYSPTGVYFLVDCEDRKLTCTMTEDFSNIFTEDVVEVFLWPDEGLPLYFEYEISPLGTELSILVPNVNNRFMGWRPWHYDGERKTRLATAVRGGEKAPKAAVSGWSVEFVIPFELLRPLANVPPQPGGRWRANIYRIDYDEAPTSQWAWDPATGGNFHDYRNFGTFVFA